jgi:ribosomal protein S6--L-glutamate ligase/gamma-F420-2:alpha-L-glutamate ligase
MSFGQPYAEWMPKVREFLSYPLVAKDCFGSFGQQVRLVNDDEELMNEGREGIPKIFQEYIECNGQDIRVEVVGGKAVATVKRKAAEGDFRANASNGGTMTAYLPDEEEERLAIAAAEALQADFAGVDLLLSKDGPVVCEVNSNAHIKNLRNATGRDVSLDILDHILTDMGR